MFGPFKKEKPIQGFSGFGGGAAGAAFRSAAGGGQAILLTRYKVVQYQRTQLITKWNKYLEALKVISPGNTQIRDLTTKHNNFLSNEVDKFLEDNIEYEKSRVRRLFEEIGERPRAKAIFEGIKNVFARTQE